MGFCERQVTGDGAGDLSLVGRGVYLTGVRCRSQAQIQDSFVGDVIVLCKCFGDRAGSGIAASRKNQDAIAIGTAPETAAASDQEQQGEREDARKGAFRHPLLEQACGIGGNIDVHPP